MSEEYSVYSEFDLEQHKKTYIDYLEVLILEDGTVVYAVPSHLEKAKEIACTKLGVTVGQLEDMCPREYYADYMFWLCKVGRVVSVWTRGYIADKPNKKQIMALRKLKFAGVYKGSVPPLK